MRARWLPLLLAALVIVVALLAAGLAEPQIRAVGPLQLPPTVDPSLSGTPDPSGSADPAARRLPSYTIPGWLDTAVGAFCVIVLIALVAAGFWFAIRNVIAPGGRPLVVDEGDPSRPVTSAGEVADAVSDALAGLGDLDADPRRAVIACWVRLEAAAAAAGTPRKPADTPSEVVLRLLGGHQVSRPVLESLARVYRAARFGAAPVDETMRQTAVTALTQLRAQL